MDNIAKFNAYLGKTGETVEGSLNFYFTRIQELEAQQNGERQSGEPYDDSEYNNIIDATEFRQETTNLNISSLINTKKRIDRVLNKIDNMHSAMEEFKKTINNKKLSSGLQGLIKQRIRGQPDAGEIINSLPESIGETLKSDEYPPLTYNKGGKSKMKKFGKRSLKKGKRR